MNTSGYGCVTTIFYNNFFNLSSNIAKHYTPLSTLTRLMACTPTMHQHPSASVQVFVSSMNLVSTPIAHTRTQQLVSAPTTPCLANFCRTMSSQGTWLPIIPKLLIPFCSIPFSIILDTSGRNPKPLII